MQKMPRQAAKKLYLYERDILMYLLAVGLILIAIMVTISIVDG